MSATVLRFPSRPEPQMTTLGAHEQLQFAKQALSKLPPSVPVLNVAARIDAVLEFFRQQIGDVIQEGL